MDIFSITLSHSVMIGELGGCIWTAAPNRILSKASKPIKNFRYLTKKTCIHDQNIEHKASA